MAQPQAWQGKVFETASTRQGKLEAPAGECAKKAPLRNLGRQQPLVAPDLFLRPVPPLASSLALGLGILGLWPSGRFCSRTKLSGCRRAGAPGGGRGGGTRAAGGSGSESAAKLGASLRQQAPQPQAATRTHDPRPPPNARPPGQAVLCAYTGAMAARGFPYPPPP